MSRIDRLILLLTDACLPVSFLVAQFFSSSASTQSIEGLAGKYPRDVGIRDERHVLFAEDFEEWEARQSQPPDWAWDAVRKDRLPDQRQTEIMEGSIRVDGLEAPGNQILKLACWHGSLNAAALRKDLGNYRNQNEGKGVGYEEVFIRYYQKLNSKYRPERNDGSNVVGSNLTQPDCWWCGIANTTDIASHGYFRSGLQPRYDDHPKKGCTGAFSVIK
jgi:hypothetical protein